MVFEMFLIIVIVYGLGGHFFENSINSITKLEKMVRCSCIREKLHRKYILMFLRSCRYGLRMKFGFANFIEKTTPLLFQSFLVDRLTDIMMLLR